VNVNTLAAGRLIHSASRDKEHLPIFGKLHPKRATPINALVLHGTLSSLFVIFADFTWLLMFKGIAEWTWYFVKPILVYS